MAGLKEIDRRRKSVRNTKKITYAMKLVSAAKLRKAQDAVIRSREYTEALNGLLAEIVREAGSTDFAHPLMQPHSEVRKIGLLVIGGGRGLCGGYNTNLNKKVEAFIKEKAGVGFHTVILGKKPAEHFRRVKREYVQSFEKLSEDANVWPVEEVCRQLEQEFLQGNIDELYVIYTKFKSALSMTPLVEKLLPMDPSSLSVGVSGGEHGSDAGAGTTIFEPSPQEVFSALVPRLMRSKVRQAGLDAKASEHGSRMTAMENATKNASEIIYSLDLTYNKLRQSRITAELLDIIGGAEAL